MDQTYAFALDTPAQGLGLRIENRDAADRPVFEAGLRLQRRELNGRNMAWALLRYPFVTAQVAVGIYLQALILWCRGARFHSHPRQNPSPELGAARHGVSVPTTEGDHACRPVTSSPRRSSTTW
jgi:DUF1365 family protein